MDGRELEKIKGLKIKLCDKITDSKIKITFEDNSSMLIFTDRFLVEDGQPKLELIITE